MNKFQSQDQTILFVAHGSPVKIYQEDISKFEENLKKFSNLKTDLCFIEHQEPKFSEKIEELDSNEEIKRVFVEPIFFFRAGHLLDDIEPEVRSAKNKEKFYLNTALAEREHFIELYSCFIKKCIEKEFNTVPEKSIFLFVGRGTSNMYSAGDVYKFSRIIWEKLGKNGEMFVSFAEVTNPKPSDILSKIKIDSFENLIVIPLVLFRGYVEKKIEREVVNFLEEKQVSIDTQFIPPVAYAYVEEFAKFFIRPYLFLQSQRFRIGA